MHPHIAGKLRKSVGIFDIMHSERGLEPPVRVAVNSAWQVLLRDAPGDIIKLDRRHSRIRRRQFSVNFRHRVRRGQRVFGALTLLAGLVQRVIVNIAAPVAQARVFGC